MPPPPEERYSDQEFAMGEIVDKAKGYANEAIGKAKRAAGDALDRPDLRAEGDLQEAKGDLQKAKGAIKGALGDRI
jgi:uncharacterized protein YjbJ (UPF0337 family)